MNTDAEFKEQLSNMKAVRAMLQASLPEEEWNRLLTEAKEVLGHIMALNSCDALWAGHSVMNLLEANLLLDEDQREMQKALVAIASYEMMGPEYIDSLAD